jgi:putative restriction endonuclease
VSADLSSRGGRQAYFATARISRIAADPLTADHFYAYVSDYLEFDRAVPSREGSSYYESQLRRDDGETSKGAFGRAVRPISDSEYELILHAGFVRTLGEVEKPPATRARQMVPSEMAEDPQAPFERPIVERLVARPFREAAFAASVKSAYSETCAMTGLRIINGGGRPEVQAAHIRPGRTAARTRSATVWLCRARPIGCSIAACSPSPTSRLPYRPPITNRLLSPIESFELVR